MMYHHLSSFFIALSVVPITHAIKCPDSSCLQQVLSKQRGGGLYEPNPNYYAPNGNELTLGDLEQQRYIHAPTSLRPQLQVNQPSNPRQYSFPQTKKKVSYNRQALLTQVQSSIQTIRDFFSRLHALSPALSSITASSIIIFIAWQLRFLSPILSNHFICNRYNIVGKKRFHAAFLSAISHVSPLHLIFNLYAFFTLGTGLHRILSGDEFLVWAFILGSALFGSVFHLVFQYPGQATSSIGLSGVTLAIFSFLARLDPDQKFRVMFIPFEVSAGIALVVLFIFTLISTLGGNSSGNVAHATHLGGMIFGILYYETFVRGWSLSYVKSQMKRLRKQ